MRDAHHPDQPTPEHIVHAAFEARFVEIHSEARDDALRDLAQGLERVIEAAMDMDDEVRDSAGVIGPVADMLAAIEARGCRVLLEHAERDVLGVVGHLKLPGLVLRIVPR